MNSGSVSHLCMEGKNKEFTTTKKRQMKNDITQHISNARVGRTYSPKQEEDLLPDNFMLGMTNETAETDYEP